MKEYRIFGPPGTGKTTYLLRQAHQCAERYGSDRILITSFTRAAAHEIAQRETSIHRDQIGTLHALCYRALGKPIIAESKIHEWNDLEKHYQISLIEDDDSASFFHSYDKQYSGTALLAEYQRQRALMTPLELMPIRVQAFAHRWEAWKSANGYFDFTDLIDTAYKEIDTPPGSPIVGFFDEVQDFSKLELALVRRWGEKMEYFVLVGDDDQCLYHFKGAEPTAFLQPQIPPEYKRILRQSFRVPRAVHALANNLVQRIRIREQKMYDPRDADGAIHFSSVNWKDPYMLISSVERDVLRGKRVMILASCGYMLTPTISLLRTAGIPFSNPYRTRVRQWNPLLNKATRQVKAFLAPRYLNRWWTPDELLTWTDAIRSHNTLLHGAKARIERIVGSTPLSQETLESLFEPEALAAAQSYDLQWLLRSAKNTKIAEQLLYPITVSQKFSLDSEGAVIVGTIHSVKGAEADSVYVFPDLSDAGSRELLTLNDPIYRLFYVAVTRAKESVTLFAPVSRYAVKIKA